MTILFYYQESEFEEMDSTVELERGQNIFEIHIDKVWLFCGKYVKSFYVLFVSEPFSIECRETKTKVMTLANHEARRKSNEPIKTRSLSRPADGRRGKRVRTCHDWFWFYFWLDEKVVRDS